MPNPLGLSGEPKSTQNRIRVTQKHNTRVMQKHNTRVIQKHNIRVLLIIPMEKWMYKKTQWKYLIQKKELLD